MSRYSIENGHTAHMIGEASTGNSKNGGTGLDQKMTRRGFLRFGQPSETPYVPVEKPSVIPSEIPKKEKPYTPTQEYPVVELKTKRRPLLQFSLFTALATAMGWRLGGEAAAAQGSETLAPLEVIQIPDKQGNKVPHFVAGRNGSS